MLFLQNFSIKCLILEGQEGAGGRLISCDLNLDQWTALWSALLIVVYY